MLPTAEQPALGPDAHRRRPAPVSRPLSAVAAAAAGGVMLAVLLALLWLGTVGAIAAIGLALLLAAVALLGSELVGTVTMVVAVLLAPLNAVRPLASANLVTFSDLFMVVAFILLVPTMKRRGFRIPLALLIGGSVLTLTTLVSSLLSDDPAASFTYAPRLIAAAVILPCGYAAWQPGIRVIDAMVAAYVAGQVISTGDAVLSGPIDSGRYEGLTVHPNFFALAGTIAAAFTLYLLRRAHDRRLRVLIVAAGLICVGACVMSGSRTAILSLAVIALVYPLFERSWKAVYVLAWMLTGALVVGGVIVSMSGQGSAFARLGGDPTARTSDQLRRQLLLDAAHQVLEKPFQGFGFANALEAQNVYLQVAAAAGLIALAAFLLILWACVRGLFSRGPLHLLGYAALTYIFGALLTASLWDRFVWVGLSLALVAGLPRPDREEPR